MMVAVFLRIFRIETNSHFMADEARDLVNIHQIFVDKKITLVGPISDDGNHLFSSLTYYLLLPFAVLYNFDPIGTVAGAVFWGLIIFGCFWFLAFKVNRKMGILGGILAACWWPLVLMSRWPWNPNLVPLWIGISIILTFYKGKKMNFLSGLAGGLALHHHFLAVLAAGLIWIKKKSLWWLVGFGLAILPFVIFDWRHPPGLFFAKMLAYNEGKSLELAEVLPRLAGAAKFSLEYLFPGRLSLAIGAVIMALMVWDVKNKKKIAWWGIGAFLNLGIFLVYSNQGHYILGALPLFWVWLMGERQGWGKRLVYILTAFIVVSSIFKWPQEVLKDDFKGDLRLVRGASEIIKEEVKKQGLVNANVAVLGSEDEDGLGKRYRGMLLTWNVKIKSKDEYELSDNLFVITRKSGEELRGDPASQISRFRNGPVAGEWKVGETGWRVVQFNRY